MYNKNIEIAFEWDDSKELANIKKTWNFIQESFIYIYGYK